jgi:hypothetical protein
MGGKRGEMGDNTNKKPIYKKWWFWVIIGVIIIIGIGSQGSSGNNSTSSTNNVSNNAPSSDNSPSDSTPTKQPLASLVINSASLTESSSSYSTLKAGQKYIKVNITVKNNAVECSNRISNSEINCELSAYNFQVVINGEVYTYEYCGSSFEHIPDCFSNDIRFGIGESFSKTIVYAIPEAATAGKIEFNYGGSTVTSADFSLS